MGHKICQLGSTANSAHSGQIGCAIYLATVSGLVLATANDEIPDICLSFSPKITRKKISGMKYLIITVCEKFLGPDGILGEIPDSHPRDPGSIPSTVFSLFFNFHPFLPLFRDF